MFIYCASVGAGLVAYQWWLEDNLLQPLCVSQESNQVEQLRDKCFYHWAIILPAQTSCKSTGDFMLFAIPQTQSIRCLILPFYIALS